MKVKKDMPIGKVIPKSGDCFELLNKKYKISLINCAYLNSAKKHKLMHTPNIRNILL